MQECLHLIMHAILYYTGCTNGCICSSNIPAGLVSILSRLHFLGQICQPFSWWLVFSTSYPRLIPLGLEVVAMVISSWWFHLGDFALVILRSINIIDHPLKNSPCFSKVFIFIWHFAFHATCILFLSFLTITSFLTTTSLCTTAFGPLMDSSW